MSKRMYDKAMQALACIDKVAKDDDFYSRHIAIDTHDFLEYLAGKGEVIGVVSFYDDDSEELLEDLIGREYKSDNTYNYNEPYTHDMCVRCCSLKNEDTPYTVAFAPHISGDVRGNYGDFIIFRFNTWWDYVEACNDYYSEHSYSFTLDSHNYTCTYSGGEYYMLECDGEYVTDTFVPEPWDKQDFIKSVREAVK